MTLLLHCIQQETESLDRLLSPSHPLKNFKQVRQTKVESSNKPLRSIVIILEDFFTRRLRAVAMPSNILQSIPEKTVLLSPMFMCAHDAFSDSGTRLAPQLVADFTDISNQMADIILKYRTGDKEEQSYEFIARNADKTAEKAAKKVVKAEKALAVAAKKFKAATAKAVKSGSSAPAKAKQNKSLVKAQKVVDDAQTALDKASKLAAEASQKAVQACQKAETVRGIQLEIVQRWKSAIAKMKPAAVCVGEDVIIPTCTERCELYLAQCTKCKGSKCRCA